MQTSNVTTQQQATQQPVKQHSRIIQAALEHKGSLVILDPSILD